MYSAHYDDHFNILKESLAGTRRVDEETFSSIDVLAEQLEKLKKSNSIFADVTFSPHVGELADCEMISMLC